MSTLNDTPIPDAERLARKRAMLKYSWYCHALIYVLVNAGLTIGSLMFGKHWHWGPLLGWGLGLAIHGMVAFGGATTQPLREHLIEKERRKIAAGAKRAA